MELNLQDVTFKGLAISNADLLKRLPMDLQSVLANVNGFVAYSGGIHFRGICDDPSWHSLELFWTGEKALFKRYPSVEPGDIPFAQDCMGDQFLLRGNGVFKLSGETGEIKDMKMSLVPFLEETQENPIVFLEMYPLVQLKSEGGKLEPGQLISAFPPFCFAQGGKRSSLKAIAALDQLNFLFDFSKQISAFPDGCRLQINVVDGRVKVTEQNSKE